ncbi:MAG: hypothetical protein H6562_13745 [Lewinellaceae bacterium]|nr:hypothetical protein [Lewinellaceae bacterium]
MNLKMCLLIFLLGKGKLFAQESRMADIPDLSIEPPVQQSEKILFIQEVSLEYYCPRKQFQGIKIVEKESETTIMHLSDLEEGYEILDKKVVGPDDQPLSMVVKFYLPDSVASKGINLVPVFRCKSGSSLQSFKYKDGLPLYVDNYNLSVTSQPTNARFVIMAEYFWLGNEERIRSKMRKYLGGDENAFKGEKILAKDKTDRTLNVGIRGAYVLIFGLNGYEIKEEFYNNNGPIVSSSVNPELNVLKQDSSNKN